MAERNKRPKKVNRNEYFTLAEKYQKTFGEGLPLMMMPQKSDQEIMQIIVDCLENGKPYQVDYDHEVYY